MGCRVTHLILPKECFPRLAYAARNVPSLVERCIKILKEFGEDTSDIEQSRNLEFVNVKLFNKSSEEKALSADDVVFRNKKYTKSSATLNEHETVKSVLEQSCSSKSRSGISVVITSSKLKYEMDKLEDGFGNYFVHVANSAEKARTFTKELEIQNKSVEILFTTREELPQCLNNLLEKITFEPLKPAYDRLQNISNQTGRHLITNKEEIECLCEEILALYEVSELPEKDRPRINKKTGFSLTKEICEDIFKQCPPVVCLSFLFNKLHVYVLDDDAMADTNERNKINTLMKKYKIEEFCITVKERNIELMEIGSTIEVETLKSGSLGCYADMIGNQTSETCLLLAKHLVQGCIDVYIIQNVKKKIATVIPETTRDECGSLDIAAAVLDDNVKVGTDERKLKDSTGERLDGSFPENSEGSNHILRKGRKVHIWGSKSRPGKGVIIDESYFVKGMKACLILVQDCIGETGQSFAQKGDSGSIICTDDPNDKCVYALAMLMGCVQNEMDNNSNVGRKYLALPLEDGVKQLEMLTKLKFKLFG